MKQIPQKEFERLLLEIKGAKPVTFTAITDARANKNSVEVNPATGEKDRNPYDMILKKTRVNGFIAYDYEAAVNRQRLREGKDADFESQDRKHGVRIAPAVSETNGVRKMVVKVQSYLSSEYFGVIGGQMTPISESLASRFIRPKSPSKSQDLDREIDHKEYNISNLETVTLDGETYELVKS